MSNVDDLAAALADLTPDERDLVSTRAELLTAPENVLGEPPIRTAAEYLSETILAPPTLVEPLMVVRGGMVVTVGHAGKGKTVMNVNRLCRWAAGLPYFDELPDVMAPADGPVKSLIIENEGSAAMFQRRLGMMLTKGPFTDEQRETAKQNILIWGEGGYSGFRLDDPASFDLLRRGIDQHQPDVIFMEPFRLIWGGQENDASEMNEALNAVSSIASPYGLGVLLSHHFRKSGAGEDGEEMSAARGSSVLSAHVDVMESFKSSRSGATRTLSWSKFRHTEAPAEVEMQFDKETWFYSFHHQDNVKREILSEIRSSPALWTAEQLHEATGIGQNKVREVLHALVEDDQVRKVPGQGRDRTIRYEAVIDQADEAGLEI